MENYLEDIMITNCIIQICMRLVTITVKLHILKLNSLKRIFFHRLTHIDMTSIWWKRFRINITTFLRYPDSKDTSRLRVDIKYQIRLLVVGRY